MGFDGRRDKGNPRGDRSRAILEEMIDRHEGLSTGTTNAAGVHPEQFRRFMDPEYAVVGAMVMDAAAVPKVQAVLAPVLATGATLDDMFVSKRAIVVYQAIEEMAAAGLPVDFVTVVEHLRTTGLMESCGGPLFVVSLEAHVFSTANVDHHATILVDRYRRTMLRKAGQRLAHGAEMGEPMGDLVAASTEEIRGLAPPVRSRWIEASAFTAIDATMALTNPSPDGARRLGCRWVWDSVNTLAGPMKRGDFHTMAGRSGYGKTAACLFQATFAAETLGMTVLLVLMESDMTQCVLRHAQQRFDLDGRHTTDPAFMTKDDHRALSRAAHHWDSLAPRVNFLFPGPINGDQLVAEVAAWKSDRAKAGKPTTIDLLIVDTIHKMSSAIPKVPATDAASISHNIECCCRIAASENCAVLGVSQFTKDKQSDDAAPPSVADLKGSGTILEASKQIILMHYSESARLRGGIVAGRFQVEKSNNGRLGRVKMLYVMPATLHIEDTSANRHAYGATAERYGGWPEPDAGPLQTPTRGTGGRR